MEEFNPKDFWSKYRDTGITDALEWARDHAQTQEGYESFLQEHVVALVEEAKTQNVDMLAFLQELDALESAIQEKNYAVRADNDVGGISPDSDSEDHSPADAHVSDETRAADGQDRSEDKSDQPGQES